MIATTLKKSLSFRFIAYVVLVAFMGMLPVQPSWAQVSLGLPAPGQMVHMTSHFEPPQMVGLKVDLKDPFSFDFIMDQGETPMPDIDKKEAFNKIIKYFLVSLAMPNKEMWVNLSPYESNRMIPGIFGQTEMGRDLLTQDYILKQLTASLMYPENGLGKEFWGKVYAEAQARFGTTDINVNTFNKVWIVADKADIYQKENVAFLVKSHLKVMLEQDFMVIEKNKDAKAKMASDIVRQVIIPAIEKEVNEGKNFASVRQVYNAEIMATWFKKTLRESLLAQVFANKYKISGQRSSDHNADEKIYRQYLRAYKKGVFNYIKDDISPEGQKIPRKYFSGGLLGVDSAMVNTIFNLNGASSDERREIWSFGKSIRRMLKKTRLLVATVTLAAIAITGTVFWGNTAQAQKNPPIGAYASSNKTKIDMSLSRDETEQILDSVNKVMVFDPYSLPDLGRNDLLIAQNKVKQIRKEINNLRYSFNYWSRLSSLNDHLKTAYEKLGEVIRDNIDGYGSFRQQLVEAKDNLNAKLKDLKDENIEIKREINVLIKNKPEGDVQTKTIDNSIRYHRRLIADNNKLIVKINEAISRMDAELEALKNYQGYLDRELGEQQKALDVLENNNDTQRKIKEVNDLNNDLYLNNLAFKLGMGGVAVMIMGVLSTLLYLMTPLMVRPQNGKKVGPKDGTLSIPSPVVKKGHLPVPIPVIPALSDKVYAEEDIESFLIGKKAELRRLQAIRQSLEDGLLTSPSEQSKNELLTDALRATGIKPMDFETIKTAVYKKLVQQGNDKLNHMELFDELTGFRLKELEEEVINLNGQHIRQRIDRIERILQIPNRTVGGIDLSNEHLTLNIKVDGAGMPLPARFQDRSMMDLKGLISIIRRIVPVTPQNIPVLFEILPDEPLAKS